MADSKWFVIKNFDDFVDHARLLVFKFFGVANEQMNDSINKVIGELTEKEKEEMNEALTHEECAIIIKNKAKLTKNKEYKLTETILYDILEEINSRLVSNILNRLVNNGILESAFDSEQNDFIFWVKDNDKKQKPETD
jgi:hypothetical protein